LSTAVDGKGQPKHIVIIGGGPGGSACALALERKATELGRPVRITLIEGKQFRGEKHYNQCVGVLSPPLWTRTWEFPSQWISAR
jgi:flavin-dependent dehydrogenase